MAILNGHTYAGGLIFALCHDFRTMGKNVGKLCLNEININFSMPTAYS